MQKVNKNNLNYKSVVFNWILIFLILFFCNTLYAKKRVSPYDYGLREARTNIDRYWVLYKTHIEANKKGCEVDYQDIEKLTIEIPADAIPIPLNRSCDFRGLKLYVINKSKDLFLFEISQQAQRIGVAKEMIDNGIFTSVPELTKGRVLLFVQDLYPWVEKRKGFHYGATRQDCLELINGKAINHVIMPYNNTQSRPVCKYITANNKNIVISNLCFKRDPICSYKTFLIKIKNHCGIILNQIETITPQNDIISNDNIYWIENCANIEFKNCTINGSYSQRQGWGYGIYMDNVYNSSFRNLKTETNWGVFCTRSMNKVFMKGCRVNRFDTHCYGRDITCKDCYFYDRECSYTSFYGSINYIRCFFDDCLPVHIDYTYDAYTPFILVMKNCVIRPTRRHDSIIFAGNILETCDSNRREELKNNQWPVINIKGLKIDTSDPLLKDVFVMKFNNLNDVNKDIISGSEQVPTIVSFKRLVNRSSLNIYITNYDFFNSQLPQLGGWLN